MNKRIEQMIAEYKDDSFFTFTSPSDQDFNEAQEKLEVKFPSEFVDFVKKYGSGGIGGVEILGYSFDGFTTILDKTAESRMLEMPSSLVVVEDVDEWLYCIDCDTGKVVSWSAVDGVRPAFPDFDSFVISEFSDAIENL